jgi:putative endonuclease
MIRVFTSKTQVLGEKGEEVAVVWLRSQGFAIVERNVANSRGEIDIVAKKGKETYFFEVKTGKSGALISPAENLTSAKLRKFLVSVEYYAFTHHISEYRAEGIIVTMDTHGGVVIERLPLCG